MLIQIADAEMFNQLVHDTLEMVESSELHQLHLKWSLKACLFP